MSCRDCKWCDDTITRNGDIKCTHPESPWQWCATDISCRRFTAKPLTVFDRITASPEVLAPHFVFLKAVIVTNINPKQQWISTITDDVYSTRAEAIAATVAKLKEVCNE